MRIHNRPATLEDLTADLPRLRYWYGDDESLSPLLPKAWERMLRLDSVVARVFEDATNPATPRRISSHICVYVKPSFADELRAGREPFLGRRVVQRFLEDESVLLSPKGIRRAHEGRGLDIVSLHSLYLDSQLGDIGPLEHREATSRSFFQIHQGIRIWQFLRDVYSPGAAIHDKNTGMRIRSRYEHLYGSNFEPSVRKPYLFGIDRQEALSVPGLMVERLFPEHTPILNLRPLHRELLNRALFGETDEDLAESLGLSLAAIKSRWKAVYTHIEQQCPAIVTAWGRNTYSPSARSRERRRHLLNYLREHLEELRPV
ncbi:MAG: hypothetical protein ACO1SV_15020 [Fimbriimonas sp.]